MENFFQLCSTYGFPMVVAGYLLIRLEPAIRGLQKSITILTVVVAKQSGVDYEQARRLVEGNGIGF